MHALIKRYIDLAKRHDETNFSDKQSVKAANEIMREMGDIVARLDSDELIREFSKLMTMKEHKIELWAAHHLMERHSLDDALEEQAMAVVARYSKDNKDDEDEDLF